MDSKQISRSKAWAEVGRGAAGAALAGALAAGAAYFQGVDGSAAVRDVLSTFPSWAVPVIVVVHGVLKYLADQAKHGSGLPPRGGGWA